MISETFDYVDYLSAKKSIDDASLNGDVWRAMADWTAQCQRAGGPVQILEIGAGTGTMVERFLENGLIADCQYTTVEQEPSFRDIAFRQLEQFSRAHRLVMSKTGDNGRLFRGDKVRLDIDWLTGDAQTIGDKIAPHSRDLLVAHAVVDLLPVPACLPDILSALKPGGGFYFSLNFAGKTLFFPEHPLDDAIQRAYHGDMDKRFPNLDWRPSQTGRALGPWLKRAGYIVVREGQSDWRLPHDRVLQDASRLFMSNILDTIAKALAGLRGLDEWLEVRRAQLARGDLRFRAANTDLFGVTPGAGTK